MLLKSTRYSVEQFNGYFKANILGECWVRLRCLLKKASMVLAGLIGYNVDAIDCLQLTR